MSAATPGSHGNEMNSDGRESVSESLESQSQNPNPNNAGATSPSTNPTETQIQLQVETEVETETTLNVQVESCSGTGTGTGTGTTIITGPSYPPSSSSAKKYEMMSADTGIGLGSSGDVEPEMEEYSEDDTEVSSEAIVDDIELILMPEEVEDLPMSDMSPKLVRVTELNTSQDYDDDGGDEQFLKMDEEDGDEDGEDLENGCREKGGDDGQIFSDQHIERDHDHDHDEGEEDEPQSQDYEEEDESTTENGGRRRRRGSISSTGGKVHSGVQTDITALEKDDMDNYDDDDDACFSERSERFEWRRRKTLTLTGVGLGASGNRTAGPSSGGGGGGSGSGKGFVTPRGKKLNWKSELTLLPSKTKIGFGVFGTSGMNMIGGGMTDSSMGFGSFNYANAGYSGTYNYSGEANYQHDQYSSRVAKFTSQDNVMSSSSQFLKPSTLYRTRNLSRNLNHFASSENTFVQDQLDTPRYKTSNTSCANFKGSTLTSGAASTSTRRRPPAKKNFRQSLPDLSSSIHYQDRDNLTPRARRQSSQSQVGGGRLKHPMSTTAGFRLQKKNSSDDETSSLIDESERCLRSSIDLLLTDDYPSPGFDYPYLPRGGYQTSHTSGYYSARRSCSQPTLTDGGFCGEQRDIMGSPFLPRKLSDMRCSKQCKVILPNGLVAVVAVKDMDEFRDCLTVETETGNIITLPFRKVVFAWKLRK